VYLFDTDHISILQRRSEPEFTKLAARIGAHDPLEFQVSIVSFHEQISGWNAYLNQARTPQAVVRAYGMFERILSDFSALRIAAYDEPASHQFDALRSSRVRIGTMDLRIAAIALASNWTLLTRNSVDFGKVPNLRMEDWSR
jgi:tRNA(fMet)-specific endonuclease VapC